MSARFTRAAMPLDTHSKRETLPTEAVLQSPSVRTLLKVMKGVTD